jgi:hypothetical protein
VLEEHMPLCNVQSRMHSLFLRMRSCATDMNRLEVLLFLIGKLGITSSFSIIVVYTTELYPTAMRSIGVGASSTVGRVGAMLAPFAPLLVSRSLLSQRHD